MKYCKECKHTEANHPFYDGVGKIKCKEFIPEKNIHIKALEDQHKEMTEKTNRLISH